MNMRYRTLGCTGIRVGEIGMGCEGFSGKTVRQVREMVDLMDAAGVNCIDLYTPEPELLDNLGRAMEGRREKFVLQCHICAVWQDGQYKRTRCLDEAKANFAERLRLLRTDWVDVGMIHYVDAMSDWDTVVQNGILDYALELKAAGIVRSVGLSSHNAAVSQAAVNTGKIDVLMFSVNPCYDLQPAERDIEELGSIENYADPLVNMDPQRQALYETCQRLGVGITVMKAFGGGDLLKADMSPVGMALTASQCLHYALTRPAVASVLCGARSMEELRASIAYEDASEEERDYAAAFAEGPLHVLRPLRALPPGHQRSRRDQVPQPLQGPGRSTGNRPGALCRSAPQGRGVHPVRRLRQTLSLRRGRGGKYEAGGGALRRVRERL